MPHGFEKRNSTGQTIVCQLRKGLYGLKQAANLWYQKLSETMKEEGFTQGKADPCHFVKVLSDLMTDEPQNTIQASSHVDDLLVTSEDEAACKSFLSSLPHDSAQVKLVLPNGT